MKLGELRGAIRKMKGNPSIRLPLGGGAVMTIVTQKTPLLEELERLFPGGKGVDTPIEFNEATGEMTVPFDPSVDGMPVAAAEPEQIDLEDAIAAIVVDDDELLV